MVALNLYNWYYIAYFVVDPNAIKETKLSVKKVKKLEEMFKKSQKRRAAYDAAMQKEALTNKELAGALAEIEAGNEDKEQADLPLEGGDFLEGGSFETYSSTGSLSDSETEDNDNDFYMVSSDDEYCEGGDLAALAKQAGKGKGAKGKGKDKAAGQFSQDFLDA